MVLVRYKRRKSLTNLPVGFKNFTDLLLRLSLSESSFCCWFTSLRLSIGERLAGLGDLSALGNAAAESDISGVSMSES